MAPLMRLIAIEESAVRPRTARIERTFPCAVDSGERRALAHWFECHDHSLPRDEIVFGAGLNDQSTMGRSVLLSARRLRVYERHSKAVISDGLGDRHIDDGLVLEHPRFEPRHPAQ